MNDNNFNNQNQFNGMDNNQPNPNMNNQQMNPMMGPTPNMNNQQPNPMMEQNMYNPNMNNQPMNNQMQGQKNGGIKDLLKNKVVLIVGGVVLVGIIVLILCLTVFKKKPEYKDYGDYIEEQEKIEERLNKNYTIKDYKVVDGLLLEISNNNSEIVDVDINVEFYNESGSVVDVKNTYGYNIAGKSTYYVEVSTYELNYSTYKIKSSVKKSFKEKVYNDKVSVVSSNVQDNKYIIQVKNDSDVKLTSVVVGVLFFGQNDTILAYEYSLINDVAAGETASGKVYLPYDEEYNKLNYERVEFKVIEAISR